MYFQFKNQDPALGTGLNHTKQIWSRGTGFHGRQDLPGRNAIGLVSRLQAYMWLDYSIEKSPRIFKNQFMYIC